MPAAGCVYYYFLLGRCVSADAAAVFAAGLERGSRSTLDAAVAAALDVTSLFFFMISKLSYSPRVAKMLSICHTARRV